MYKNLFKPIKINGLEIKNRIIYPALGLLYSYDKKINNKYSNFYIERAKGGAGIVTVGPVGFDKYGAGLFALSIETDEDIPAFKILSDGIKNEGARSWIQLYHAGAYTKSGFIGGERAIAPSEIPSRYSKETPREMTIEDIKTVQENFALAALRAKEAGFDGVEIIGSAGYLITQFLSPLKNQRKDEYGGSFENRTRFVKEIITLIRKKVGKDYPLSIRMAGNDFVPGSNTSADTPAFAKVYEEAGIDFINVTGGWHESRVPQLPMDLPRAGLTYLAANIRKNVSIPVAASNRITDPHLADQLINDGVADMICLGRVLLADPYWPQKAMEGRENEIRPCVACSQGCTDTLFNGKPVYCITNPFCGFEGDRKITKTASPKKVMVIGAGPAGMEAAVTAAQAGHDVSIYDKADDIGGQLWIAGTPPHKQELWEIVHYYDEMLFLNDVDVYLETEVTPELIKEADPDFIIAAEGAEPAVPPIDGIRSSDVLSSWEVLRDDPMLGRNIAVIGGGAVGLETAHFLAAKGTLSPESVHFLIRHDAETCDRLKELVHMGTKNVTVFEMLPKAGNGIGRSTKWVILGNLDLHGVKTITGAKVLSIKNGLVTFEKNGKTESIQFDNVINAAGSRSVKKIADVLPSLGIPFTVVGDSVKPAQIDDAIHGGFFAALEIDKK